MWLTLVGGSLKRHEYSILIWGIAGCSLTRFGTPRPVAAPLRLNDPSSRLTSNESGTRQNQPAGFWIKSVGAWLSNVAVQQSFETSWAGRPYLRSWRILLRTSEAESPQVEMQPFPILAPVFRGSFPHRWLVLFASYGPSLHLEMPLLSFIDGSSRLSSQLCL